MAAVLPIKRYGQKKGITKMDFLRLLTPAAADAATNQQASISSMLITFVPLVLMSNPLALAKKYAGLIQPSALRSIDYTFMTYIECL